MEAARGRLRSIDALRGIIMILMALDHVRWFLSEDRFDPTDLERTSSALFFTRWITHFCAPGFVFLAGTGVYLYGRRRGTPRSRHFLWTRGLWLVVLELTLVRFGWLYNFDYRLLFAGVIWMIGACMLLSAALIQLRPAVLGALGAAIVLGHDLLTPIEPSALGTLGWLWVILHEGGRVELGGGVQILVLFSLLPWLGVMWLGVAFGRVFELPIRRRRRACLLLGSAACVSFLVLRLTGLYGDPHAWEVQDASWKTVAAFLNVNKYPASLQFLLMTLGPLVLLLPLLDSRAKVAKALVVFGRVPLLYYLLHLLLIHGLALLFSVAEYGAVIDWLRSNWGRVQPPAGYGYGLVWVYLAWMAVVGLLYPPCAWFARVKDRSKAAVMKYL